MLKQLSRESNKITISSFYEDFLLKKYNFDPPYQRLSVWSDEKKSFFIDSILKNLPVPPIFLRQIIDDDTGKTTYDVIDGKQRLTAITEFIAGIIPTTEEGEDPFHDPNLAGKYFEEMEGDLSVYKKQFWRYVLPIEYVDTEDNNVIDKIFDRLNRNGEPLTGQELRHSNYYDTLLLATTEKLSKISFWSERLNNVDKARMENIEFISELLFFLLEENELKADQSELDRLYKKYTDDSSIDWEKIENNFNEITNFMDCLNLNYSDFKIAGVSHLYGLWCFSYNCHNKLITANAIKQKLSDFFTTLRDKNFENEHIKLYKESMSYNTKSKGQRIKRTKALLNYSGVDS
ncbi:DUF262 domain-containing protein [Desulfoluna spongiiphila]|uniref:DUF262 domain-containing protein n=1 Tax=Desulfoluna spongiiphila TaxID=419481 RepID=UPI00125840A8|nr:DUF262 domain-containing protein [Desulfoluna spongiiphila]VVS90989.1 domain of unknown function duf262 [Desulfoluna spongiiphila]